MYIVKNMSVAAISELCCASESSVRHYVDRFNQTGEVKPAEYQHRPPRLLGNNQQFVLLRIILQNPGLYLSEIQIELFAVSGQTVSIATICQTLQCMGCTRQALQHIAIQRSDKERAKFMAEISMYNPNMIVWLDETGSDRRHSTRKWSYGIHGITPRDHHLLAHGERYSAIAIMPMEGLLDVHLAEGTVNGLKFEESVKSSLIMNHTSGS